MGILSAKDIFLRALEEVGDSDVNYLHLKAYEMMLHDKARYYQSKVDAFLDKIDLPQVTKNKLRKKLLQPIEIDGVEYSNFMEEASRRISQSFQITSGRIAELCVRRELERNKLKEGVNFSTKRRQRADVIAYYPNMSSPKKRHRVEVKNVKMRERGARGLSYDGDSLIGFFDSISEFSPEAIAEIERLCTDKKGYAYVPPSMFQALSKRKWLTRGTRIKPNTMFGQDMSDFCKTGKLQ